jgi:SAM-dependent methyltransferase
MATSTLSLQTTADQFETIYQDAHGDQSLIPWGGRRAQPALINWLNAVAPSIIRCGSRVCVVGCGLGEDARELIKRGYDVTAFDCSKTAVNWARQLDPDNARCYQVADLFNPPPRWKHRFDLVVEINTIQALAPEMHASSMQAISQLMSPHGHLLVICRGAQEPVTIDDGPPWALTRDELLDIASSSGLNPTEPIAEFNDDEVPPVRRMRGMFRRN